MSIVIQVKEPTLARMLMLEAKRCGFYEGRGPSLILIDLDHFPTPVAAENTLIIGISAKTETLSKAQKNSVFALLPLPFSVREFEEIVYQYRQNAKKRNISREGNLLLINGKTVRLSKTEARLFDLLYRHRDRVVTEAEMKAALGDSAAHTNTVAVYLYRLRRKLFGSGAQIRTLRGSGCQWIEEEMR
ncbi:MAG: helix-turn-helix domain-containing protein [Ruminococcaceae bacterium]|nr:helix-turn-helix domain-containing protein [Oscillospiraceae bacterium]